MSIFSSHEEKARKALDEAVSHHAMAVARLDAHDLVPPDPGNAEAIKSHRTARQSIAEDVDIAAGVIDHWRTVCERLDAEASEKAAAAEHIAEEKAAKADEKLARDLDAALRKAAEIRDKLAISVARTHAYNQRRGSCPHIPDAEERVRRQPERIVPASYRAEIVWEDASGRRPSLFRRNEHGDLVPQEGGFTRKTVKVCQSNERVEATRMPERYADALKLVDLEGRPL